MFGLRLSSCCWVCFPFLPYFFLLAICVSHCFPNLCDYFICFLMSLSSAALLPTRLHAFTLFSILFPLSPLPYLIFSLPLSITCLFLPSPSHFFLFACLICLPSFLGLKAFLDSFHSLRLILLAFCHLSVFPPFLSPLPHFCPLMPPTLDPLPGSCVG